MVSLIKPICAVFLAAILTAGARDTFTREEFEILDQQRKTAEAELAALQSSGQRVRSDIENLDAALIAAAMETHRSETAAADAEKALAELAVKRRAAETSLLDNANAFEDLIAALAASNRRRPPALIVSPTRANDAIRRAILMSATSPRLSARAGDLKDEITALNDVERDLRGHKARLATAEAKLAVKNIEIEQLATAKRVEVTGMRGDLANLRARAERLGAEAGTLRDLLAALEAVAPGAPSLKPRRTGKGARMASAAPVSRVAATVPVAAAAQKALGKAKAGSLTTPTSGPVLYRFGDTLPTGGKAEWITYTTPAEAQILAPASGKVEYARPFRSYGSMLILRTSDNYHVILTGMSRIYVTEGQSVKAGEPVGRMPDRREPPPELNMELRSGDTLMNPADWLTANE
jgi:murein hydrolase activator